MCSYYQALVLNTYTAIEKNQLLQTFELGFSLSISITVIVNA